MEPVKEPVAVTSNRNKNNGLFVYEMTVKHNNVSQLTVIAA